MTAEKNQLATRPADRLDGTFTDPKETQGRLKWAAQSGEANLVAPAPSVGVLPEGCAVSFSRVWAGSDCYSTGGGRFGLGKTTLNKIASAAGVSWDPIASGRLDDGSHPHYCRWRAVGSYVAFDGTRQVIVAEKEMDMREHSAQVEALQAKAKNGDASKQIREMRQHIQSHAETKAQLRAIRSLGVQTGYPSAELERPFVVARLMFTGETEDPVLRREFARMTAKAMLGGRTALFGGSELQPGAQPSPAPARLAPPPVSATMFDGDDDGDDYVPPGERYAPPERAAAAQAPAAQTQSAPLSLPAGASKGKPLQEAAPADLQYWSIRLNAALDEGTSRDATADARLLAAIDAEIDRRSQGAQ